MSRNRKTRAVIALAVLFLLSAPTVGGASVPAKPGDIGQAEEPIRGQYIVTLKPNADVTQNSKRLAREHNAKIKHVYTHALKGFGARMSADDALELSKDPAVESVTEDSVVTIDTTQSPAPDGLDRIDQRDLPLDDDYNYGPTGAGVHAYIIDTGIRTTHDDFGGRASVGTDERPADGQNGQDCNSHGTHVSGILGGSTYGAAKDVSLVSVRVLGCNGSGSSIDVIDGIDWVTANAVEPAVANLSLGGGPNTALDAAVQNSISSGITYTIAAGNDNGNACNSSPSRVIAALTVAASSTSDARASFSNFGVCVDLFAPGVGITSDVNDDDSATGSKSGTSMSAPLVGGVVAQYLQGSPTASPDNVANVIRCAATMDHIANPGTGTPNRLLYNAFLPAAAVAPCAPPLNVTTDVGLVHLSWTAPLDGGDAITEYKIFRGTTSGDESPVPIDTVPASELSFDDTTAPPGARYYYQVAAVNTIGETRSAERSVLFTSPATAFVVNSNRTVSWRRHTGTWTTWQNLGGYAASDPASTSDGSTVTVFVRGSTNAIYYQDIGVGTSGWQSLGGALAGNPTVATDDTGTIVLARNSNGTTYWRRRPLGGAWSAWKSLGGYVISNPTATGGGTTITVFARGWGNVMYYQDFTNGVPGGWKSLGGQLAGDPAAATDGGGITLVARNANNAMYWQRRPNGGPWSGWKPLGGVASSDPAAAGDGGMTRAFVRGGGNAIYVNTFNGTSWSGWSSLGGGLSSRPAAAMDDAGTTLVARGGSVLWWRHFVGGSWTPWASLGGSFTANPSATPG